MMTQTAPPTSALSAGGPQPAGTQPKKSRPVIAWAAAGTACLLLEIYVFTRWILSGPHGISNGPSDPGHGIASMEFRAGALQVIAVTATLLVIWFKLIKPLRRDRQLSMDGVFVIVMLLMYWQDPGANYWNYTFTYNTYYFNIGSWAPFIPGWVPPNFDVYPEPILVSGGVYVWGIFAGMLLGNVVMRAARRRLPHASNLTVAAIGLAFFWVFDVIAETFFMWAFAYYTYPNGPSGWTLNEGHYYQFPWWEMVLFGTCWAAWSYIRFFCNDRGQTIAERGVDDLRLGTKTKAFVRVMAVSGIFNVIFMVYNTALSIVVGSHPGPWPDDITSRSYFMAGACGAGTTVICNGDRDVPVVRSQEGYRITPDGKLLTPEQVAALPPDPARAWKPGDPPQAYWGR